MNATAPARWFLPLVIVIVIVIAVFISLIMTNVHYGYAIDEASYVYVAREVRNWFSKLVERPVAESFSHEAIVEDWHFLERADARPTNRHSNFNLPMAMHVMNAGWLVAHKWCPELLCYRLGSMVLFSLAVAMTFATIRERTNTLFGLTSALLLYLNPRPFAHAHLAATETALSSFWLLSLLCLARFEHSAIARGRTIWGILSGICFGCLIATKLTGWLIIVPVGVWLAIHRPHGSVRLILTWIFFGIAILLLATPNLWLHPFDELWGYVRASLDNPWKISTSYGGFVYQGNMPIESGIVIFCVTNPLTLLTAGALGLLVAMRDRLALLLTLSLVFVLTVRTFGLMPTHDVDRQFAMAYYLLPCLAGLALGTMSRWLSPTLKSHEATAVLGSLLIAIGALAEPYFDWQSYRNHGLCYFNRAVGGLHGAAERGFEISYWFEAVTDQDWRNMIDQIPHKSTVFFRPDHPGIEDLISWKLWRRDIVITGDPQNADYLLLYAKPSFYSAPSQSVRTDLWRVQQEGPANYVLSAHGVRLLSLVATGRNTDKN